MLSTFCNKDSKTPIHLWLHKLHKKRMKQFANSSLQQWSIINRILQVRHSVSLVSLSYNLFPWTVRLKTHLLAHTNNFMLAFCRLFSNRILHRRPNKQLRLQWPSLSALLIPYCSQLKLMKLSISMLSDCKATGLVFLLLDL